MAGKRARLALISMLMALALGMCLLGTGCEGNLPPTVDIISPEEDATVGGIVSVEAGDQD